ncbi:PIN domain-containing protein [Pseudomonas syringae]|uniref:PIN domain-containing protein n=1 Tax=Pseudomonas syringae TaxID=317 RepID=UPI003F7532D6
MKFHAVVIDANILIRDYLLRGNALQKIVKTKNLYGLEVCIPEVVRDECIGNFGKDIDIAGKDFISLSDRLDRLGLQGVLNKNTVAKQLDLSRQKYIRRLDAFMTTNCVTLLPYPTVSHKHVVEKMYQRGKPFTDSGVREKGYKDYLIVASIREYFKRGNPDNILFLTDNVGDFACAKALSKKENQLLPLDEQYCLPDVYVARTATALFNALSVNLGQTCSGEAIKAFNENLVRCVIQRCCDTDAELLFDFFTCFIDVNIHQETICCEVIESQVQIDNEAEIMEAKGIIKITFKCSFSVDNLDVQLKSVDNKFVFMGQIKERIFQERLPWRGEWSESFSNVEFSKEFLFEYIEFEYVRNEINFMRDLDALYLSMSRL